MLGPGTYVETATSKKVTVEVDPETLLLQQTIEDVCKSLQVLGKEVVRCSVDMHNRCIHFTRGTCAFQCTNKLLKDYKSVVPSTESETLLLSAAKSLCTIDYDNLVPALHFDKINGSSVLKIKGLLHISHDTVMTCLSKEHPLIRIEYDFQQSCLHLCVPHTGKRKRST